MSAVSIWHASPRTANTIDAISKIALVIGALALVVTLLRLTGPSRETGEMLSAVLLFLGTLGSVWASGAKELHSNSEIAEANARAEEARAKAAEAELALGRERSERESLQEKVSSRRLSPQQRQSLIDQLRQRLPLTVRVQLISDQEANIYGANVVKAIQQAGVQVEVETAGMIVPPPYGLEIQGPDCRPFVEAFQLAKISFGLRAGNPPMTRIIVGLKPPAI